MKRLMKKVRGRRSFATNTEPNPFEESVSIRTAIATTFLEVTSVHAIPDCAQAKNKYSKIFWFILFIICGAVGTWQVILLIKNFTAQPHYIAYVELKREETAEFPNVTVCNFNRASKAKQDKFNITYRELNALWSAVHFQKAFRSDANQGTLTDTEIVDLWNDLSKKLTQANVTNDIRDIYQSIQPYDNYLGCQMIFSCYWKGVSLYPCCINHTKVVYRQYGVCYTITLPKSGNEDASQDSPGSGNGLRLVLNPQLNDYFEIAKLEENDHDYRNGIALQVDYGEESTILSNPVGISPGSYNYISMKKHVEQYEPNQYLYRMFEPNCIPQDTELMFVDGHYTRDNCIMDCYQKLMHKTCNCTFLGQVKNYHLYKTCDPHDVITCLHEETKSDLGLSTELSACSRQCNISCGKRFHVDYSLSAVKFPGTYHRVLKKFFHTIYENTSYYIEHQIYWKHNPKDMIMVDIFFSDNGFLSTVHHEKEDFLVLIAEIGGHFGLWLGVSVVSLIQILYYLLAWIFKIPVETSQFHNKKPVIDPVDAAKTGPLDWCTLSKHTDDEIFDENVEYGNSPQNSSPTPSASPVPKSPKSIKSLSPFGIQSDKSPYPTTPSVTPNQYSPESPNPSVTPNMKALHSLIPHAHQSPPIFGTEEHFGDDSIKALVLEIMKDVKKIKENQGILSNEIRMDRIVNNNKFQEIRKRLDESASKDIALPKSQYPGL